MKKIPENWRFYILLFTMLFHMYLMYKTYTEEKEWLTAILIIPVSLFAYKLTKMFRKTDDINNEAEN